MPCPFFFKVVYMQRGFLEDMTLDKAVNLTYLVFQVRYGVQQLRDGKTLSGAGALSSFGGNLSDLKSEGKINNLGTQGTI